MLQIDRNKVGVKRSARIIILGSGFAGVEVLKKLQKEFVVDEIEQNALKMKSIADASILRNHLIEILEQAHVYQDDIDLKRSLITFVVVGGGFNGIETVGELAEVDSKLLSSMFKLCLLALYFLVKCSVQTVQT
jgi:NADH dehydrogenase FAD-containing subunit